MAQAQLTVAPREGRQRWYRVPCGGRDWFPAWFTVRG